MEDGRFTTELWQAAEPIWEAQLAHPFVRGIADGTLDEDRFRGFVRQDYAFLVAYARVLALAAERSPTDDLSYCFAALAHETLTSELELHRALAAEWGIGAAELAAVEADATTTAYTDFLLHTGTDGEFAELAAALLPCMWGYSELGRALAAGPPSREPRYARWIATYAAPEFAELAAWCRSVVDELGAAAAPELRGRMREAFLASARHELAFWQASWERTTSIPGSP